MLCKWILAFVLLTFGHLILAQVPLPGKCPDVKIMSDFDLNDYMGIWYENTKYPFIFEVGKKCCYAEYKNFGNGTISVMNAAINRFTNSASSVKGYGKVLGPARLAVVFSSNQDPDRDNYDLLGTDYKNYAVVYSCNDLGVFHTEIIWILTRERKPSEEIIATAKKIIDDNNLSQKFLIDTVQDDCPNPGEYENNAPNENKLALDTTAAKNAINKA